MMPRLYVCLSAHNPYLRSWKCSFSCVGNSTIRTAGLPSIRQTKPIVRPGTTFVMNNFSPLTIYSLPSRRAVVRRAVKSLPADGSVSANALRREPSASPGRNRRFCSAVPNVRTGSTAPMQPWTDASPATVGSKSAIRVRNGANELNGAPKPPYSLPTSSPQYPAVPKSSSTASAIFASALSSVPAALCRRTAAIESSITRCTSAGVFGGARMKSSTGTPRSQTARCAGLLIVWYSGEKSASTWPSAVSIAPVRRASSALLPPSFSAVSANDVPSCDGWTGGDSVDMRWRIIGSSAATAHGVRLLHYRALSIASRLLTQRGTAYHGWPVKHIRVSLPVSY